MFYETLSTPRISWSMKACTMRNAQSNQGICKDSGVVAPLIEAKSCMGSMLQRWWYWSQCEKMKIGMDLVKLNVNTSSKPFLPSDTKLENIHHSESPAYRKLYLYFCSAWSMKCPCAVNPQVSHICGFIGKLLKNCRSLFVAIRWMLCSSSVHFFARLAPLKTMETTLKHHWRLCFSQVVAAMWRMWRTMENNTIYNTLQHRYVYGSNHDVHTYARTIPATWTCWHLAILE